MRRQRERNPLIERLNVCLRRRTGGQTGGTGAREAGAVNDRLNELERRMTDVQDVLISMDEKLGRTEGKGPRN